MSSLCCETNVDRSKLFSFLAFSLLAAGFYEAGVKAARGEIGVGYLKDLQLHNLKHTRGWTHNGGLASGLASVQA